MHRHPTGISKTEKPAPASTRLFPQDSRKRRRTPPSPAVPDAHARLAESLVRPHREHLDKNSARCSARRAYQTSFYEGPGYPAPDRRAEYAASRRMDAAEECLPWNGAGILAQPDNQPLKRAAATAKDKLSPFAHGYNNKVAGADPQIGNERSVEPRGSRLVGVPEMRHERGWISAEKLIIVLRFGEEKNIGSSAYRRHAARPLGACSL